MKRAKTPRTIQDAVFDGAVCLIQGLADKCALKHSLVYALFHHEDISPRAVCEALPQMNSNTVKTYLTSPGNASLLLLTHNPRALDEKRSRIEHSAEEARQWIVDTCEKTQSGRAAEVRKTPRSVSRLWRTYRETHDNGVSYTVFERLCHEEHVHFGVGKVDSMTCVQCRAWNARVQELEDCDGADEVAERGELMKLIRDHERSISQQREAHWADLDRVLSDNSFGIITVDFSKFETMDRGGVRVLCAVLTHKSEDGTSHVRTYIDFLDLQCSKRRRDTVAWLLIELKQRGLLKAMEYVMWSDAGTSDFHNAPAIFAFNEIANHFRRNDGPNLASMNFFASRHGWSDCDRHFGAVKRKVNAWYANEAPEDISQMLDFHQLTKFLQEMRNTTPIDCRNVHLQGVVCDPVPLLTIRYCFEPNPDGKSIVAGFVYSSDSAGVSIDLNGNFISYDDAVARVAKE